MLQSVAVIKPMLVGAVVDAAEKKRERHAVVRARFLNYADAADDGEKIRKLFEDFDEDQSGSISKRSVLFVTCTVREGESLTPSPL